MKLEFITLTLLSGSFVKILSQIADINDDKIAKYLLEANTLINDYKQLKDSSQPVEQKISEIKDKLSDFARQLTLKNDTFEISFILKDHTPEYSSNGNWLRKNRQSGKPGKIIQKVIGKGKFTNADYEQFVYHLKAIWSNKGYDIKLVKGEDIRKWYFEGNYFAPNSTLGCSCMRYEECEPYFDIYCNQSECQMLIALKEGLLAGRALVWTVEDITFLDRVYYIEDCIYSIFKEYAISNKWAIRVDNSLLSDGDDQMFLTPKDEYQESTFLKLSLTLNKRYESYPYMDTFRYLDINSNILYSYKPQYDVKMCSSTEGYYNSDSVICPNCGDECDDSNLVYSSWFDETGCESCMEWSRIMNDYIYVTHSVKVFLENYKTDVATEDWLIQYPNEYVNASGYWVSTKYENLYIDENGVYRITE